MIPQIPLIFGPPAIGKDIQENRMVTTEFGDVFDSDLEVAVDVAPQDVLSDLTGISLEDAQDVAAATLGFSMPARPIEPVAAREIRIEPPVDHAADSADAQVDLPKFVDGIAIGQETAARQQIAAGQQAVAGIKSPQRAIVETGQAADVVDPATQAPSLGAKPFALHARDTMVSLPMSGPAAGSMPWRDQVEPMAVAPIAEPALAPLSNGDQTMPLVQTLRQTAPIDSAGPWQAVVEPAPNDFDLSANPIQARPTSQGEPPPLGLAEPMATPQDMISDRVSPALTPVPQMPPPRMQLRGPTAAESAFQSQVGGGTDERKMVDPERSDPSFYTPRPTAAEPERPLKPAKLIAVSGPSPPLNTAQILPFGTIEPMARDQDPLVTPSVITQTLDRNLAQKQTLLPRSVAGPDQMPAQDTVFSDTVTSYEGGDNAPLQIAAISPLQLAAHQGVVPQTPIPSLVTPQHLAGQILSMAPSAQNGSVELILNPAELGHLRFEIQHRGEHVQIVLTAERPETLDMLRKYADQLTSEFRNSGFLGASLSFGSWGGNQDHPSAAPFLAQKDDDQRPISPAPIPALSPPRDLSRNLNLRL